MRQARYSEAFKLEVVRALESGACGSVHEAARRYGLGGNGTIVRWLQAYGKDALIKRTVYVMKADEEHEVKGLRDRVRKLEKALADAHLDVKLEQAYVRVACRAAGIEDVEAFKKKHAGQP